MGIFDYRSASNAALSVYNPLHILSSVIAHGELIGELIKRDVAGRYKGSFGGVLWSFIQPLFMLGVYTLVFGSVFRMRWGGADSTLEFSLVLFSGLIVFNFFAECVGRAPTLVIGQPNYVKKVVFPLEIFPWVSMGSALFHGAVSLLAWIVFYAVIHGVPPWTLLLLPLVLFPLVPVVLGFGWMLSALGVYVRDIAQVIAIAIQALLFLSPVFFSLDTVPEEIRPFMLANPLTFIIDQARRVLLQGALPDFLGLGLYTLCALLFAWLGFALFQKLRSGFADVI